MANYFTSQLLTLAQLLPKALLSQLPVSEQDSLLSLEVSGLCLDSRQVQSGDLFISVLGESAERKNFIAQAVERGALAVLLEKNTDLSGVERSAVPLIEVNGLADYVGEIASAFYGNPSEKLSLVGITGTNGKTTCSQLLAQLYTLLGHKMGVIGTLGCGVVNAKGEAELTATGYTTPDAVLTQKILADMAEQKLESVAMEVSSHGLSQGRVNGVHFSTAVFTNLSHDHLDYHGDMEAYAQAKSQLFMMPGLNQVLINIDDAWGQELLGMLPGSLLNVWRYSMGNDEADIYCRNHHFSQQGVEAEVVTPWGEGQLRSSLLGEFNLSNLLAVIGAACAEGLALVDVLAALPKLKSAAGRMQAVDVASDINVVVDFAHTPDALQKVLQALRKHTDNNLTCVFGCGGDRDRAKRPAMASIAEQLSDSVIVTSDNPRTENPDTIIADVVAGLSEAGHVQTIASRSEAVATAIAQATAGDTVLLAGKGHEDYQLVGDQRLPFSDINEARLALRARNERLSRDNEGEQ